MRSIAALRVERGGDPAESALAGSRVEPSRAEEGRAAGREAMALRPGGRAGQGRGSNYSPPLADRPGSRWGGLWWPRYGTVQTARLSSCSSSAELGRRARPRGPRAPGHSAPRENRQVAATQRLRFLCLPTRAGMDSGGAGPAHGKAANGPFRMHFDRTTLI